jgi:hypothetical protein
MLDLSKEKREANAVMRKIIEQKLASDQELSIEEIWFMGDQIELDHLPNYPQCLDMYYRKLYILFTEGMLKGTHLFNFQILVTNWLDHLQANYKAGSIGEASQNETKIELESLEKKWQDNSITSEDEKDEDLFDLIAWSKFRYVLVRKIFDLKIKTDYYTLTLDGNEIRFDYESTMHILTRHFGHGMKPYPSPKDHFYGVFRHDELHKDFENIFDEINKTGLYGGNNPRDINFRFKGVIYKIWATPVKGVEKVYRISTFFPVSSKKLLDKLGTSYQELKINEELSVFVELP